MASWETWFSRVRTHAPDVPDPLLVQALIDASREFFKESRAWMEWLDPAESRQGVSIEYDFDLPAQTEMVRIEQATRNGRPLVVKSYREPRKDWTRDPDMERCLVTRDLLTYVLTGDFPAGDVIQVQASLMPSERASGIPDHMATRYRTAIAEGAKALVLMTPDTNYYKPDQAALARAQFDSQIGSARFEAFRGLSNAVPRATPKWC